ncbi:hypothetical protein PN483_18940 [Nodularia spumigena CS-591/04]|uniref:NACHT C-terminal alpha/beta 1 domain-containing protein n=1 Tax=Nodularia spumigena TaxID=70799 RepID=UPI0023308CAF|nr:hypothetical protein [Nodularia spumigena]MDB9324010.1 hypothetical protein [Nodularia spumigena CS-591/07A]MDB9332535.1 hypothetical protein [Nodularia spumigena CS-591/04]MDB9359748.1 hypothetical protein [Nodularia spumigena CS-588/02]MDB9365431.1 hypothetical protein [Nodularia spumigena CS-588/02A10]
MKNQYLNQEQFTELFYDMFWTLNRFDPNHYFVVNMLNNLIEEGKYWYNQDDENPKIFPYDEITTSNLDIIKKLSEMLVKSYNCIVDKRNKEKVKKEIKKKQAKNDKPYDYKYDKKNFNNSGATIITGDYGAYLSNIAADHIEEDKKLNNLVGINEKTIKIAGIFNDIKRTLTRIANKQQNILNIFINILKQEWNDTNFEHDFCLALVISIAKFEGNKQELIDFMNENLLNNNVVDNYRRCCVAEYLLKIEPENNAAINILIESLANIKDDKMSLRVAATLVEIKPDNPQIINKLIQLLYRRKINDIEKNSRLNVAESILNLLHKDTREKAISYLAKMAYKSNDARIVLDDIFQNSEYIFLRENVAWRILEIEPTNEEALNFLLDRYKNQDDSASQFYAEEALIDFMSKYPEIINNFIKILCNCKDTSISNLIIWLLGEVKNETYQLEIVTILQEILQNTNDEDIICYAAKSLGKIDPGNTNAIDPFIGFLNSHQSDDIIYSAIKNLETIADQNTNIIIKILNIINNTNNNQIKFISIKTLGKIGVGNLDVVQPLINLMNNPKESENYWLIRKSLIQILQGDLFAVAVTGLKDRFINEDEEDEDILHILWHCAENMTYPEFYRAWHGEPSPLQNLETQLTDTDSLLTQLQPTSTTYPLTLNLKTLQDETDISAISQEICNQIYFTACNELEEIPAVNNAPQLKRIIPQIKKHLQTENIAVIINNCEPNQAIVNFCHKLTDVLHIAFTTKQPLDAPLRGFPPNQSNLLSAIQSWINEIE